MDLFPRCETATDRVRMGIHMANEQVSIPVVHGVSVEHNARKGVHMANEKSKLADELKAMQYEPLLPV